MTVTLHMALTQRVTPFGDWLAFCRCGWTGTPQAEQADARREGDAHLAEANAPTCGRQHVGRCTEPGSLFTKDEAVAELTAMGFAWNEERADYERGDLRGRLSWQPDYCNPDNVADGTRWFLTRPYSEGTIAVLPKEA